MVFYVAQYYECLLYLQDTTINMQSREKCRILSEAELELFSGINTNAANLIFIW